MISQSLSFIVISPIFKSLSKSTSVVVISLIVVTIGSQFFTTLETVFKFVLSFFSALILLLVIDLMHVFTLVRTPCVSVIVLLILSMNELKEKPLKLFLQVLYFTFPHYKAKVFWQHTKLKLSNSAILNRSVLKSFDECNCVCVYV